MRNFNPFGSNWRLCKKIFLYRDFSIVNDGCIPEPAKDGTLEKKLVYESTPLNWFEVIQRLWNSEDCYIRHKDNLENHILLDKIPQTEIDDAEWLAEKLSRDQFMERYVTPYFNTRRLS